VRLAVQQLLDRPAVGDRSSRAFQRVHEQGAVRVRERRRLVPARDESFGFRNPIREMGCRHVDLPHAGVQPRERAGVVGCEYVSRRRRLVVGPQRDREPVSLVHARLDARIEHTDRAAGLAELLRELDFELRDLWPRCATRATTSHGVRRSASLFESWRTTTSSAGRPSADAIAVAAATARETSDASIAVIIARSER